MSEEDDKPPTEGPAGDYWLGSRPPSSRDQVDVGASSGEFSVPSFGERYVYRKPLGAGGMGVVNLCRDQNIGRDVAMKVARPLPGSPASASWRFVREARVQGQLEHPSIVPVYELGRDPDGAVFFTMQRVKGRSLAEVIEGLARGDAQCLHDYPWRKLLRIFARLCLSVEFVHSHGVIHRDIKPENVMLGDYGEVYLLDWGLAKIRGVEDLPRERQIEDAPEAGKTQAGEVLGTLGYMSPEQARGDENVDHRADVYALGTMLFEILALEPMHQGDGPAPILYSTTKTDGARPGVRRPERDIPPELDQLCHRCTRLAPDDRISTSREIADGIEAFLDGDRDLALRAQLGAEHAERAAALLEEKSEDAEARGDAMREVTAALGLDPTNTLARETLVRLLTQPPQTTPPGALQAMRADAIRSWRAAGRLALGGYVGFLAYVPLTLWMGIRDWRLLGGMAASIAVCAGLTWFYVRRPPEDLLIPLPHLIATSVTMMIASVMFGPFVMVPVLAATNGIVYLAGSRDQRLRIVVASALALIVPVVLQWGSVLPPSYEIAGDAVVLLPRMMHFPPTPTMIFLLISHLAIVVTAIVFVRRIRGQGLAAERALQIQAWHLRQIVPEGGPA